MRKTSSRKRVFAAGLVIRDLPHLASNWRAAGDLGDYLRQSNVVGIADIDTRKLTRILREKGAQNGCIVAAVNLSASAAEDAIASGQGSAIDGGPGPGEGRLVHAAVRMERRHVVVGRRLSRCGGASLPCRRLRLRRQAQHPAHPGRSAAASLPWCRRRRPARDVFALRPDGVFLSNGPGDPEPCDYAVAAIREIVDSGTPTFGICLGHQLLGLASGARTVKMKFGHHGANHPVLDKETGQVLITSQNHGFAVDAATLPANVRVTHVSLFDGSLQGIARTDRPAFSFQGHPEASPGPHDLAYLFDRFVGLMAK